MGSIISVLIGLIDNVRFSNLKPKFPRDNIRGESFGGLTLGVFNVCALRVPKGSNATDGDGVFMR